MQEEQKGLADVGKEEQKPTVNGQPQEEIKKVEPLAEVNKVPEKIEEDKLLKEYRGYRVLKTKTWSREGIPDDPTKPVFFDEI
jgi:hypothetical protein